MTIFAPVMSNGLGVESVAILLRWILEPETRDFDLKDLIVVTVMTGKEWPDTIDKFHKHILPLFRKHGIRYVQLGRVGILRKTELLCSMTHASRKILFADGAYMCDGGDAHCYRVLSHYARTAPFLTKKRILPLLCLAFLPL